jgi:hypothetical protein
MFQQNHFRYSRELPRKRNPQLHHFLRIDRSFFCAYIHIHRERKFQPAGSSFQKKEKKAEGRLSARSDKNPELRARSLKPEV